MRAGPRQKDRHLWFNRSQRLPKEVGGTFVDIPKVKIKLNSFELMTEKKEPDLMVSPAAYDMESEMTVNEPLSAKASSKLTKSKRSEQQ